MVAGRRGWGFERVSVGTRGRAGESANAALMVDRQVQGGNGALPAYVSDGRSVSYEELLAEVGRMGNLLRAVGVRREERVLLVLDDTVLFPAAFIGALRIGAVPVPVSVREHRENFRHFIEDCYARVVVCEPQLLDTLRAALFGLDVTFLSAGAGDGPGLVDLDTAIGEQDADCEALAVHPEDMAFWLYTSGSTGRPKGVVHLHRSIPAVCETFGREIMGLTSEDRVFSTTKLYHSYGLGNSFAYPLHVGASAVLLQGPPTPERLLAALRRHRPTVICSVPALYRQLLDDPDADGALDSVRMCISAAEPLPPGTLERWRARFGQDLLDGIGATEMFVTFCTNRSGDVGVGTTGRPTPGYELRLAGEDGAELAGPAEGALQVRGPSRAARYWHQQERTDRTMQAGWLTTGDRMRRDENGRYVYVGRNDDMLKVGGLWVSPIDMEIAIAEHAGVAGVAVVGARVDDQTRLAAFVERAAGAVDERALSGELRDLCAERLREYEQPHIIRFVDELPRTSNGKPRRFMLRTQVEQELAERGAGAAAPATETEALAAMASEERTALLLGLIVRETGSLLGMPVGEVAASRTFASLGVDSLMAVELRGRLTAATGLRVPSTLVFDRPTPEAAARALSAQAEGRESPPEAANETELAALEALDAPPPRTPMPGARPGERLKTSALANALLPPSYAVARAERMARELWARAGEDRTRSIEAMRIVLSGTAREGEIEELAAAHLTESLALRALFWQRPWTARTDPAGAARIAARLADRRGVLLSACHLGPYQRLDRAEGLRDRRTYTAPGPWFFEQPDYGLWGRRLARWRRGTKSRTLPAAGSFRLIQALLEKGEPVFVFFDLPGPRETSFLGKPAMLADGTAQLAVRASVPVLPMRARREGHRVVVEAAEPLDPREFAGVEELHAALASQHEAWILEEPAAAEDPRQTGWEDGARPDAWVIPGGTPPVS